MANNNACSKVLESLNGKKDFLRCAVGDILQYHEQITMNAKCQKEQIEKHFDSIKCMFNKLIEEKVASLKAQVDAAEKTSLKKVQVCKEIVEEGIKEIDFQLNQDSKKNENAEEAKSLEDVNNSKPCLTNLVTNHEITGTMLQLSTESQSLSQLKNLISLFGKVSTQPFVVISDVIPKTTSIVIKWKVPEMMMSPDERSFVLQMLEVGSSSGYSDIYKGSQTSFIARNLKPVQEYSFRVSLLTSSLPLWSITKSTSTLSPRLKWKSHGGCNLLNGGSTLSSSSPSTSLFVSSSRSYACGDSLMISVEALPDVVDVSEDGFGLSTMDVEEIKPMDKGTLFLTCSGLVYVGNQKMTTRLPSIKKGSIITFDSVMLPNNKLRVTIEVEEKVVTFDWIGHCDLPNMFGCGANNLHFFARLSSPGWMITAE